MCCGGQGRVQEQALEEDTEKVLLYASSVLGSEEAVVIQTEMWSPSAWGSEGETWWGTC